MPNIGHRYLLDSNILIDAHRKYYGFDLCPGFWKCILFQRQRGVIFSIDHVKDELDKEDKLGKWTDGPGSDLFVDSAKKDVYQSYKKIINWVKSQTQFTSAAVSEFAQKADSWVIAYAKAKQMLVATHEIASPNAKKRVKIPDICKAFNVKCVNTYTMLKDLYEINR